MLNEIIKINENGVVEMKVTGIKLGDILNGLIHSLMVKYHLLNIEKE